MLSIAVLFGLGLSHIIVRGPSYSSSFGLFIDHYTLHLNQNNSILVDAIVNGADVDSQVELLRSGNVMARAFELAKLSKEEFTPAPFFLQRWWQALTGTEQPEQTEELASAAPKEFAKLLNVKRVGDTFTIVVEAKYKTPEGALRVANAVSTAYFEELSHAYAQRADATSAWLRNRMRSAGITARVISKPTLPLKRDGPSSIVVLIASLMAGLGIGVLVSVLRDYLANLITTPAQARQVTQAEWLGALPYVFSEERAALGSREPPRAPAKIGAGQLYLAELRSRYANTMTRICAAAIIEGREFGTLGITSLTAGEGKSTVALNLARIAGINRQRVLLVDAACHNRALSQKLAPKAAAGLCEVLRGELPLGDAIAPDKDTGFHFLPLLPGDGLEAVAWLWGSIAKSMEALSANYDLVLFDLPAIEEQVSVMAAAQILDGMLFVIQSGKVSAASAESQFQDIGFGRHSYRGVVLNKVNRS